MLNAAFGIQSKVSTHSRLKAAGNNNIPIQLYPIVSTHSRLKAAGNQQPAGQVLHCVSTHSRLKAAGRRQNHVGDGLQGFNTQPPEGGWRPCTL